MSFLVILIDHFVLYSSPVNYEWQLFNLVQKKNILKDKAVHTSKLMFNA